MLQSFLLVGALAAQAVSSLILDPLAFHQSSGRLDLDQGQAHVELDCPACPFAGPDGNGSAWMLDQGEVKILLDFDISADGHTVQLNKEPFFPAVDVPVTARQLRVSDGALSGPLNLAYALDVLPLDSPPSRRSFRRAAMTKLTIYLLGLEDTAVHVDVVELTLSQSRRASRIVDLNLASYSASPGAESCDTIVCRLRAIVAAHIDKLIKATKSKAHSAKEWAKACCCSGMRRLADCARVCRGRIKAWLDSCCSCVQRLFGCGEAGRGAGHGHDRHHHHQGSSRAGRVVHAVIHYFVIPFASGALGGFIICAIATLLGRGMSRLMKLHRSRRQQQQRTENSMATDEKHPLVLDGEAPPQYADADGVVIEKQ